MRSLVAIGCIALFCACPALAQDGASVQGVPPSIQSEIAQAEQACTDGRVSLEKGFITRENLNGAGVQGYVLDYRHFSCGGRHSLYCGIDGCEEQVFAPASATEFQSIFDGNVRALKFAKVDRRPAMIIDLHSPGCSDEGKVPCDETLFWDGSGFGPAK